MASTTSLLTALSGLSAHSRNLEVLGNNVANVNTTAYKSSRLEFSTSLQRSLHPGSAPAEDTGGVNPYQVGLGVAASGTLRNFSQGSLAVTGDSRDMAIDGAGFFIAQRGDERVYTRNGAFRVDQDNNLVAIDGSRVMGFQADANFVIPEGALSELTIPLGLRAAAAATTDVRFAGNLNSSGEVATRGSLISLMATLTQGFRLIAGATAPPTAPNVLEETSLLTEIEDPDLPASGTSLFTAGQSIELSGARRGGSILPEARLAIEAGTTVADLLGFLRDALSLHDVGGMNPDGRTPGAALDAETGAIAITGHTGAANALDVPAAALRLIDAAGSLVRLPFAASEVQRADGESVRTVYEVFDSLGARVTAGLTLVYESSSSIGTTWRYYADSIDDADVGGRLGTGLLSFDTQGRLLNTEPIQLAIDRPGTGAVTPLAFAIQFADGDRQLTATADQQSQVIATFRDGRESGTLEEYSVDADGTILGSFSNATVQPLGRVALGVFRNPGGLIAESGSFFREGSNSGPPEVLSPASLNAGRLVSGSLEQSNVDLGREFINMILTSTGYSASSRVIRTTDELLQQLLVIGR